MVEIISYGNFDTIRKASGSPAVWYVFSNIAASVVIDNLGTGDGYVNFDTAAGIGSTNLLIRDGRSIALDLRVGSVSILQSGTNTPDFQVVGLR